MRGFNNQNQLLFRADFGKEGAGLFLFTPGGNPSADFDWDTFVDATDLGMWQAAYGLTPDGDADSDGDSDGNDFLAWQRQFTGPGISTSNLAVPEPGSLGLFLTFLAMLATRRPGRLIYNLGIKHATLTGSPGLCLCCSGRRYEESCQTFIPE